MKLTASAKGTSKSRSTWTKNEATDETVCTVHRECWERSLTDPRKGLSNFAGSAGSQGRSRTDRRRERGGLPLPQRSVRFCRLSFGRKKEDSRASKRQLISRRTRQDRPRSPARKKSHRQRQSRVVGIPHQPGDKLFTDERLKKTFAGYAIWLIGQVEPHGQARGTLQHARGAESWARASGRGRGSSRRVENVPHKSRPSLARCRYISTIPTRYVGKTTNGNCLTSCLSKR